MLPVCAGSLGAGLFLLLGAAFGAVARLHLFLALGRECGVVGLCVGRCRHSRLRGARAARHADASGAMAWLPPRPDRIVAGRPGARSSGRVTTSSATRSHTAGTSSAEQAVDDHALADRTHQAEQALDRVDDRLRRGV